MSRKLGIGILAAVMLLSGMVGVSFGGGGITQPEVIKLINGEGVRDRDFALEDPDGKSTGSIWLLREPVVDVDGNAVGTFRIQCIHASGIGRTCTDVAVLKPGPHTDAGTIVMTGLFRGFNGESLAVTGGTGAYANVRGHMTLTVEGGEFVRTLYLIP